MARNDRYTPNDRQPVNDYRNPVGSVDIYGTGGSVRHRGDFSQDNPWLYDMTHGANNQDIDAAFERAANWEADRWTVLEQRKYDEARLAEQREYDSPLQQIARERAAGINRDVAGGSGSAGSSGSSAQLQSLPQPQTPAQTKFSNSYDNTNIAFNGINTAMNVLSSVSNFGSSVVDAIGKVRKMPSEIGILSAQSQVAQETASSIISSRKSESVVSSLQMLKELSPYISESVSDDDAKMMISELTGLTDDEATSLLPKVRYFQGSKPMQEFYANQSLRTREAKARDKAYNDKITTLVMDTSAQIAAVGKQMELHVTNFGKRLATLTDTEDYAQKTYDNDLQTLENESIRLKNQEQQYQLQSEYIARDIVAFSNYLKNIRDEIKTVDDEIAYEEDMPISVSRDAYINTLKARRQQLMQLGSSSMNDFNSIVNNNNYSAYMSRVLMNTDGSMRDASLVSDFNYFAQPLFHQYVSGLLSERDIAEIYAKSVDQSITRERNANDYKMQQVNAAISVLGIVSNSFRTGNTYNITY